MHDEMFSLRGKTTLVTGGARGIGRTVAQALGHAGSDLVLFDLERESLETTADDLRARTGRRVRTGVVDVTDHEAVRVALDEAWQDCGPVQLLFNNAGIVIQKPAIETSPEEWRRVIDVNLNGVFNVAQLFGKKLIDNDTSGSIVNTGSMSGTVVNYPQLQASYNTSKAGVVHLTKSLAFEWAECGIRVNCISPGYIFTDLTSRVREDWRDQWAQLTPMKRLGRPEELASAVVYFLADSASFTTGAELIVDGGFTTV
ncbi:SDR family oxidoreductase [Ornithinimicrobium pratense]|uniref:SDR family oxidoreductase n=1 Tax=Ornithinimicrobium pratense TaxID=2593973 RepID=A0A5J6V7C5_9MICO|nr:SDR family oxidoreductase [Ornithinimicrobium pratense]QFG69739.1 SDR family oxidoreductase [Ornithinimicrobium pratense]